MLDNFGMRKEGRPGVWRTLSLLSPSLNLQPGFDPDLDKRCALTRVGKPTLYAVRIDDDDDLLIKFVWG